MTDNLNDAHDICEKGETSSFLDPYFQKPSLIASTLSHLSDDSDSDGVQSQAVLLAGLVFWAVAGMDPSHLDLWLT